MKVGDTITTISRPCDAAIAGFEDVKPMVFAGVYPTDSDQYEDLRASLEKLRLNDASLTFEPESSLALGVRFPLRVPRSAPHGDSTGTSLPRVRYGRDNHRA